MKKHPGPLLLLLFLCFSLPALADGPSSTTARPSQMLTLVSSGTVVCPHGGYALDQMIDPTTLAHLPLVIPPGTVLLLTSIESLSAATTFTLQNASASVFVATTPGYNLQSLADTVVRPGTTLCAGATNTSNTPYLMARGHLVRDN